MLLDNEELTAPVRLRLPINDLYLSIPEPTAEAPNRRVGYHVRTNLTRTTLVSKRYFPTAEMTYSFIRRNGHPITNCSTLRGCPGRIQ